MKTDSNKRAAPDGKRAQPAGSKSIKMAFGPMLTLLLFSTAMLIMPLGTYFYIRRYIVDSTTMGAMGAVVVVQIIIAAYIFKAWRDENKEHQENLRVKNKKKA